MRTLERSRVVAVSEGHWTPAPPAERFGLRLPSAGGAAGSAAGMRWTVPAAWTEVAPSALRAASFRSAAGGDVSITTFPGDGGGLAPNANRWRGQVGCPPLGRAGLEGLERVPALGRDALLVEVTEPCGEAESALLGAICFLDERAVFVKLTGSPDTVRADRAGFLALCASLELVP